MKPNLNHGIQGALLMILIAIAIGTIGVGLWEAFNTFFPSWKPSAGVQMIYWSLIGLFGFFYLLPLIPGAVKALTNNPNRYRHLVDETARTEGEYPASEFGIFTYLEPGRVKIIERGDRFMGCIMRFEGHCFAGKHNKDLHYRSADYWEVIKTPTGTKDTHPIPIHWPTTPLGCIVSFFLFPVLFLWWCWKRWVYFWTGAVYVGLYPLYPQNTVRVYKIHRLEGRPRANGGIGLNPVTDYSDHYRVADFQLWGEVPKADTRDKVQVKVETSLIARTKNPYKAAYYTDDDWLQRVYTAQTHVITQWTRHRWLDQVVSAQPVEEKKKGGKKQVSVKEDQGLADAVAKLNEKRPKKKARPSVEPFGIYIEEVQILDISPTDPKLQEAISARAIALENKRARILEGEGEAAYQGLILKQHEKAGELGRLVVQTQAMVNAAEKAGDKAIVILGGQQSSVDPMMAKLERNTQPPLNPDQNDSSGHGNGGTNKRKKKRSNR